VRKDGGLSRPGEPDVLVQQSETGQLSTSKTYGLMELARGTSLAVGIQPEDEVPAWPHLVFRELLLFLATMAVVMFLSVFWNAPLEELANPTHPPNPAKAPWYFLGLQELVAYSAFWGGVAVPALLLVALILLPYLDRKRAGVGVWFARERRVAVTIFTICVVATVVFTVIGTYFRGPNWGWVWPWTASAVTGH
jgi:quinol-cytochrome oxidoreductase complex cytochrome b subunit